MSRSGRLGTVSDQWVAFPIPTPWTANTTRPQAAADALPVLLRPGSGRFAAPVTVRLETPVGRATVYYTLDGADPTLGGLAYTAPLEIAETTVLRAVALRDGAPVSAVTTATYLVGENTGLPVVSLVTEPAHLWDATTGIYVNSGHAWSALGAAGDGGVAVAEGRARLQRGSGAPHPRWEYKPVTHISKSPSGCTSGESTVPASWRTRCSGLTWGRRYDRLVLRAGGQRQFGRAIEGAGVCSRWGCGVRAGPTGPGPARGDGADGSAGTLGRCCI